jgi:hypothetical protein
MTPFRDYCDLPAILNLFVVLLHRGFMRRQLCMDLGALITGFAIKILLHIGELIVIKAQLSLRDLEIAIVHRWR